MDPHRRSGLRPKGPPRPSPVAGGHSPCCWWPLAPGAALDVGCGEGGYAIWLARRGWDVTALDVSEVALQRGFGWSRADRGGRKVAARRPGGRAGEHGPMSPIAGSGRARTTCCMQISGTSGVPFGCSGRRGGHRSVSGGRAGRGGSGMRLWVRSRHWPGRWAEEVSGGGLGSVEVGAGRARGVEP